MLKFRIGVAKAAAEIVKVADFLINQTQYLMKKKLEKKLALLDTLFDDSDILTRIAANQECNNKCDGCDGGCRGGGFWD